MKIKKFLEKVAEEDRESLINDKDVEFLASIGVDYEKKRDAAKTEPQSSHYLKASAFNYRALLTAIPCCIVAALIVATSLFYTLRPSPVESPVHYFDKNFVTVNSNLQELNADLQLFIITVDDDVYDVVIKRTYDSFSSDNLYYTLDFTTENSLNKKFKLDIVVNKFYKHEGLPYTNVLKESKFSDYTLKYEEKFEPLLDEVNCKGEMQIGEQWIYIVNYTETAYEHSAFIETLQSLITFK